MDPYKKNLEQAKAKKEFSRFLGGSNSSGRVMGGIVILVFGAALLAYELGLDLPRWFFSWKMFLIGLGLFIGARHNFKSWGWLIPIGIGVVFLAEDIFWQFDIRPQFIWPVAIIIVGLVMIFRPKKKKDGDAWHTLPVSVTNQGPEQGEVLDTVAIFGSAKKNILSKNFRGGDVIAFFGGSDLNFTQADIQGVAILDMTTVFGGAKLVVPSNWTVKTETVSIFGGTDDKRQNLAEADPNKVLVIEGTVIFGGIEIKSY
jgi:predicted membrane protein